MAKDSNNKDDIDQDFLEFEDFPEDDWEEEDSEDFIEFEDIYGADRPKKKKKKWVIPVVIVVIFLVVVAAAGFFLFRFVMSGKQQTTLDPSQLGIVNAEEAEPAQHTQKIRDFALFCVDTSKATEKDPFHCQGLAVTSINYDTSEIKITSILKESEVTIEGHGKHRLYQSYRLGGAPFALKTINQNYGMDLQDYMTVDISKLADMIDKIGGIDLELTEEEADILGKACPQKPVSAGQCRLDGEQAVAYAGISLKNEQDFSISRQQKVLENTLHQITGIPLTQYPSVVKSFMDSVETTLEDGEILEVVLKLIPAEMDVIRNVIPDPEYESNVTIQTNDNGNWGYVYDLEKAGERLHNIIYGVE